MIPRAQLHRCCGLRPFCCVAPAVAQRMHQRLSFTAAVLPAVSTPSPTARIGRLSFDASKAGLEKVDKAHVQSVIEAATRGSAFAKSEQRKEAERSVRHMSLVEKQRAYRQLTREEQKEWEAKAAAVEAALESTRDFTRIFIHIDMDMFYAAVEEKHDPALCDRPFAVGSMGMLATSNYIARQYGVRSGMPGFIAKKLCPSLWIQPPHFELYRAEANAVRAIAATYDPAYVTVGLDELTMDITEYLKRHNNSSNDKMTSDDVCAEFRARVEAATQLTCSGGVSHTAAFSKLASRVHKPNGQHTVKLSTRAEVLQYVRDMPVRCTPGIGQATGQQLKALGILTCKDFLTQKAELCYIFREKTFAFYLSAGLGLVRTHVDRAIDDRATYMLSQEGKGVVATSLDSKASSMKKRAETTSATATNSTVSPPLASLPALQKTTGKSITLSRGFPSPKAFLMHLRQLVHGAHDVLVQQGAGTRRICFYTTDRSFTKHSYSVTLPSLTTDRSKLYKSAFSLAMPFAQRHREFRLIGVTFSNLQRISVSSLSSSKCANALKAPRLEKTTSAGSHRHPKHRRCESQRVLTSSSSTPPPKSRRSQTKSPAASSKQKTRAERVSKPSLKVRSTTSKAKHSFSYVRHV